MFVTCVTPTRVLTLVTPTCVISYIQLAVTLGYEQLLDDITLVSKHGGVIRNK
jgi:hypothetical protein